ncbi:MAG: hypothetical protein KatS3mg027_1282 [Bacteroidia bacterium]|nr:MAG: hypothetical protein KatS3mg027_1282 [Bacteroidia bacterium]
MNRILQQTRFNFYHNNLISIKCDKPHPFQQRQTKHTTPSHCESCESHSVLLGFLRIKKNITYSYFVTIFFSLFLFPYKTRAQLVDSLKSDLHKKPGIDFGIETRNSFLLNDTVKFRGIKAGIRFGKKLKLGVSFNWLKSNIYNKVNYFYDSSKDTTSGYFKMAYFSVYTKIVYHKTKRWEFTTPLQIGYGHSWLQNKQQLSFKNQMFKKSMIIYEPTVSVQFKLLKWFGIAGNIGYRFVWHRDENILSHLNGPIYVLNLNLMLDQLFFEIFPDSEITQKYGPAEW